MILRTVIAGALLYTLALTIQLLILLEAWVLATSLTLDLSLAQRRQHYCYDYGYVE